MLGGVRLTVAYNHEKTCFAYLNSKYCSNNDQAQTVQVLWKDKQIILWAVFSSNITEGKLAINPIYSRLIGLEEGSEIYASPYADVMVLDELYVETDSPDDQEILEQNTELLQLRLLDQLRLVVKDQKAVVWISVSLPIVFTAKKTGILVNHSKVIVKMDAFDKKQYITPQHAAYKSPTASARDQKFHNLGIVHEGMLKHYNNKPETMVLRAIPIDSDGKRNVVHPYKVFVHEDFIQKEYKTGKTILADIELVPSLISVDHKENSDDENNENGPRNAYGHICVEVIPIDHIVYRSLSHEVHNSVIPTVLIPKSLNNLLSLENGTKVIFNIVVGDIVKPDHIEIKSYIDHTKAEIDVVEKFKNCVIECTHSGNIFIINNGIPTLNNFGTDGVMEFKLQPENVKFTTINSEDLRLCTVSVRYLDKFVNDTPKVAMKYIDYDSRQYCRSLKSLEELVKKIILHIVFDIHRESYFKGVSEIKGNVLVTGLSGSGKSSLCQIIEKEITVWSHTLHCRSLKGRKDITEVFGKAILMCQEHSPAVLICDDIDALVPPNTEGAPPQDIAYYQRLAVVLKHLLQACTGVSVLMTAMSLKALHPTLRQFSGKPLFTAQFDIAELEKVERIELLRHLLNDNIRDEFDVDEDSIVKMAADTAGHNVRDIIDYLNKTIFKAMKRKFSSLEEIRPKLVESSITSTELKDAFDIWGPIGGMDSVKQELTECIFWPLIYPALFPSQSCGILLYGPPGTGKSYIGSCLARLTNMSFISVKGPELLSKYIGQSEKAVRDIFDKADMKRPCILFFDEFDSLAPKRGHDSTGVTDRVVNQLLVRLDGAEGGARGPVLVATSRPDLVDPALLRPGRLQRHIYCALPDQQGRLEVLKTLAQSVNIGSEVDLPELAARTEGFSPADLRALLVTAQLSCLEKQLDKGDAKKLESVLVGAEDVEAALAETKPSLSREQRVFYDMIYKRFRGERLSGEETSVSRGLQKQRVTLA